MIDRPPRAAGGIFIAVLTIGGAGVGALMGQMSAGLLGGFAAGVVAAIAVALWDARRS